MSGSSPETIPDRRLAMTDPIRDDDQPEALVSTEDIGSASRSCLVIIFVVLAILLLLLVFVIVQTVR